jgi:predicted GTPase
VEPRRQQTLDIERKPPARRHQALLALIKAAAELENHRIEREAQALAERVADGRFFVACLGQFKRGKSSLLNALVGTQVLPTGVVPVTAIVTIVRYGPILRGEVHFENGAREQIRVESISNYVSEAQNPANYKVVAAVEVFVPSALLATGMCLVDTPGVGSTYAGNTAVTKAFVPHIDAALAVLGADPPISGEELALLDEVASQVTEIVFVLNKADRLSAAESDEAAEFVRRTLSQKLGRETGEIFRVSAAEWLEHRQPCRGAPALMAELERLALHTAPQLVEQAERRGIDRLSAALIREIDNQRTALIAPIEESQATAARLRQVIDDAERSLGDLRHLFKAEQERVSRRCSERRDALLAVAIPAARSEFHEAIILAQERRGRPLNDRATEIAQTISRRLLNQWLEVERPAAEQMYRDSARRFIDLANDYLERIADSGEPMLAELPRAVTTESGFRVKGRLYFGEHFGFPRQSASERILDVFRSRRRQLELTELKVARYLETLLSLNSTRILNDFDEIIRESGRRLEAEIRSMLLELRRCAETMLARAETTRAAGTEAVRASLDSLVRLREQIEHLRTQDEKGELSSPAASG